jgi:hypothetical protein
MPPSHTTGSLAIGRIDIGRFDCTAQRLRNHVRTMNTTTRKSEDVRISTCQVSGVKTTVALIPVLSGGWIKSGVIVHAADWSRSCDPAEAGTLSCLGGMETMEIFDTRREPPKPLLQSFKCSRPAGSKLASSIMVHTDPESVVFPSKD